MENKDITPKGNWNAFCLTSFILSLIALLFFWLIVPGIIGGFFGILLGIPGIRQSKKYQQRGQTLAVWGLVLSCLGFALSLFWIAIVSISRQMFTT